MTPLEFANVPDGTTITVRGTLMTHASGERFAVFKSDPAREIYLDYLDVAGVEAFQAPAPGPILAGETAVLNGVMVEVTDVYRNLAWITLPNGKEANTFIDLLIRPTLAQVLARAAVN